MEEGFSYESFAGVLRVSRSVLYDWEKSHPEFLDAKKVGTELSLLWWEKQGKDGVWNHPGRKTLSTGTWAFNMKNRFGWTDKQDVSIAGGVEIKLAYDVDSNNN